MTKRKNRKGQKNPIIERTKTLKSKFSEVDTFLRKVINNLKMYGDSWLLMVRPITSWARLPIGKLIYDLRNSGCNTDVENLMYAYNELIEAIEARSDSSKLVNVSNAVKLLLHALNESQRRFIKKTSSNAGGEKNKPNDLITLLVAVKEYRVSRATLKRAIKVGNLKSYRKRSAPKNSPHMISRKDIERYYNKR